MSTGTFKGENPVRGRDAACNKIFNVCFGFKEGSLTLEYCEPIQNVIETDEWWNNLQSR
jgi:hypothetical protein